MSSQCLVLEVSLADLHGVVWFQVIISVHFCVSVHHVLLRPLDAEICLFQMFLYVDRLTLTQTTEIRLSPSVTDTNCQTHGRTNDLDLCPSPLDYLRWSVILRSQTSRLVSSRIPGNSSHFSNYFITKVVQLGFPLAKLLPHNKTWLLASCGFHRNSGVMSKQSSPFTVGLWDIRHLLVS